MVDKDQEEEEERELPPGGHLLATTERARSNCVIGILLHPRWHDTAHTWDLGPPRVGPATLTLRTRMYLGDAKRQITLVVLSHASEGIGATLQQLPEVQHRKGAVGLLGMDANIDLRTSDHDHDDNDSRASGGGDRRGNDTD